VASADDAKCVNTANKNAAKVAKAQGKDIAKCLKDGGGGKLTGTIEECITSDPKGKVKKATDKLAEKLGNDCAAGPPAIPPIDTTDPNALSEILIDKELAVIHTIFGTDLDAPGLIVKKVDNKNSWKCQSAIAKAAGKCQDAKLASYNSCKKAELERGVASAQALQDACLGANGTSDSIPDTKGKIDKKCGDGLGGTVGKKCAGLDTDALFPPCASQDLAQCLDQKIECEVCKALDALDGLGRNCDEFDNGVADGSCDEGPPTDPDPDGDGWNNGVESCVGSHPIDPNSNPETAAIPETCNDHVDNDGDGAMDQDDTGCIPQGSRFGSFPPAGLDVFESSMTLTGYRLATPLGICPVDFDSHGPTCVQRGDPGTDPNGRDVIDVEIIAMQLRGTATILADPNCGLLPGPVDVNIYEDPDQTSGGQVAESSPPTPGIDFPAESFFDVYFQVETLDPNGEPFLTLAGGPPGGPAGAPVRVDNTGINSLPPHHTPGNTCVNPNCYAVPGLPHLHCPKLPLDHFKVWDVVDEPPPPFTVDLQDQFGDEPNTPLIVLDKLANPVRKATADGRVFEILDPHRHLTWYSLFHAQPPRSVVIHNQFGHQTLTVRDATHLLVSATKNAPDCTPMEELHFKCYDAEGVDPNVPVALQDQFDDPNEELVRVREVAKFCNPVTKNGEEIYNVEDHLACYRIDPPTSFSPVVSILDQFHPIPQDLNVLQSEYLCVPTHKHDWVEILPCELGPWPICGGFCPESLFCDHTQGFCQCLEHCESESSYPTCGGHCSFMLMCVDVGGYCLCL
jgi:hypothetical protein